MRQFIFNKFGYKKIYNDALMEMITKRLKKLETAQLTTEDFMIKGALRFLKVLKKKGIKLYLFSGTDREDVLYEAEILGYADLFDGGIYGSVGDINKYSKKMVLDQILNITRKPGDGQIATFGDGPVEIRETHKRGGITIGIASNELRRFGLNESKRTRLIKAGADVIVPDFSQSPILLRLLNIN